MIRNYLLLAGRNLRKQRVSTVINVSGLAIGIACCVMLFLYVDHELRYDSFHTRADSIFRIVYETEEPGGGTRTTATTPPMLADEMETTVPGVENTVRIARQHLKISSIRGSFEDQAVEFADASLFDVFSFDLERATGENPLADPGNAVLSREAALAMFGDEDPLGRVLTLTLEEESIDLTVAGILREIPSHSSLKFNVLVSYEHYPATYAPWLRKTLFSGWSLPMGVVETYVDLSDASNIDRLTEELDQIASSRLSSSEAQRWLHVQNLEDIHLATGILRGLEPTGNPDAQWILLVLALAVLLIACINFVTLMAGRSVERAREVGVRKVMGARAGQIRAQFLGEACLTAFFALLAGLVLVEVFLPTFNTLSHKSLTFSLLNRPVLWFGLALFMLVVATVSGMYPAVLLSRFEPVDALKGSRSPGGRNDFVRILVGTQFALAIAFLSMTVIMSRQLDFMMDRDLGFNPDRAAVVILAGTDQSGEIYEAFRTEAEQNPGITDLTGSFFWYTRGGFDIQLQDENGTVVPAHLNPVRENYVDVMGMNLVAGRTLRESEGERGVIVNEALVRAMGWKEPIGRTLPLYNSGSFGEVIQDAEVVGVVRNFHTTGLQNEIEPLVLASTGMVGGNMRAVTVRIAAGAESEVTDRLSRIWRTLVPDRPVNMVFMDQLVEAQYEEERRWRAIAGHASFFILLISCSGLFGLVVLLTRRRTREIGVRKVLGASLRNILALISREYVVLVALAAVPGTAAAYWAGSTWLEGFAYRTSIGLGTFFLATALVLSIALVTVGFQAGRAARRNPVESLRTE